MSLRCPECGEFERIKVVDTRPNTDYSMTRRRLLCDCCGQRFTTHERYANPRIKLESEARFDDIAALLATAIRKLGEIRKERD